MQIKVLIVDDELPARSYLSNLLKLLYPEKIVVLEECDSVKTAVVAIQNHKPDLIFLDVQMPEENGLELFNYFTKIDFKVVFTTAYKDFAIDAIKLRALDYLLKPLTVSDVREAIIKYELGFHKGIYGNINSNTVVNSKSPLNADRKMVISTKKGFEVLNLRDIIYFKAEDSYTCFYTKSGNSLASKTFKESCETIVDSNFIKVHKSYVVNVNYIKSFNTSEYSLVMLNGEIVPVSDKSFTKKRLMDAISR